MKSLRVPFKTGGIFGKIPLSLRNAHSYLSPQHNLYLLQLSHLFRIFYQDLPFSLLQSPFALCFQQISVPSSPVTFSPSSNQKSWERPRIQPNQTNMNNKFIFEPLSTSLNFVCFVTLDLLTPRITLLICWSMSDVVHLMDVTRLLLR